MTVKEKNKKAYIIFKTKSIHYIYVVLISLSVSLTLNLQTLPTIHRYFFIIKKITAAMLYWAMMCAYFYRSWQFESMN